VDEAPRPTVAAGSAADVGDMAHPPASARTARRQALWTLLSQVLSSLASFALTIAVARAVDQVVGGAFTYAFLIFSLMLGLSRAITIEPLVIRFSAVLGAPRRLAIHQATGASIATGLLAGLLVAGAGLVVGGVLGTALLLLLAVLPGHFLQDAWRSAAFAAGRPAAAAANDAVRFVVQSAALVACTVTGTDSLTWYLLSWAGGAWAGAITGILQFGRPAGLRRSTAWLGQNVGLSMRLGSDYAINMGTATLTTSLLAALLGLAATGGLRFALSILGPIQVLFGAMSSFMVPTLARRLSASGPRSLWRPALTVSAVCLVLSAFVVGVLLLLPDAAGEELLGRSWDTARDVMPGVGAAQCAIAVATGPSLALKAMGRADLLLRTTAVQAPLILLLGVGGGLWIGIVGAAWGMALAQVAGAAVVMLLTRRATARSGPRT
jgi:O-antigen/teichoic acid export membrane protein